MKHQDIKMDWRSQNVAWRMGKVIMKFQGSEFPGSSTLGPQQYAIPKNDTFLNKSKCYA